MRLFRKLLGDVAGGTMVEYAFIAALIAVGSLTGIKGLGGAVGSSYNHTANAMADASP